MENFIYFDYEADSDNTFHLLGQRYLEKTSQWSLNRALDSAAKCSNIRIGETKDATEQLLELALRDSAILVAYSTAEAKYLQVIFEGDISSSYKNLPYLNMATAAKRWVNRNCAKEFQELPDYSPLQHRNQPEYIRRQINNSLASRMRLTNFKPPRDYGIRRVMTRINYVLSALERHQDNFQNIPRAAKKKWTQVLKHNRFDVEAMEVLTGIIMKEDPQCLAGATKTIGEIWRRASS